MRAERERVNDMGLYILLAVLAVLVIFIGILLIRAALAAKKAEPIGEKPVYTTEQEDIENGERLMKMIECQTVSSREIYDDTEFSKLRTAVKELFPLLHERAEIKYFSEDCWVYKIPGRDESRNILLMSLPRRATGLTRSSARYPTEKSGGAAQSTQRLRSSRSSPQSRSC